MIKKECFFFCNGNFRFNGLIFLLPILLCFLLSYAADAVTVVFDPYAGIDWSSVEQHKANLHAHTTQSDGQMPPHIAIDEYRKQGFTILALTDHNLCTWPWTGLATLERKGKALQGDNAAKREPDKPSSERKSPEIPAYEDRNPEALGMLAVAGNEPSIHHHMGAFFIQYETRSRVLEQTLKEVAEAGGMAMIFHPGRYWEPKEDGTIEQEVINTYTSLFRENPHAFGVEVINQGMRYKNDVQLWDKILMELMPTRPVFGYAGNDMHKIEHLGREWSIFLLPELNESNLREAFKNGCSYFSTIGTHDDDVRNIKETPIIQSITHDADAGYISIVAVSGGVPLPDENVKWISADKVVHSGPSINYRKTEGVSRYLRAELIGKGGTTYTNPYGLSE